MDLYDFISAIATAAAQDAPLAAWASAQLDAEQVTVFIDIPGGDLPKFDDNAPFVVFSCPEDSRGLETREITYHVSGWCGLISTALIDTGPANLIQPAGVELIIDFMTLIRAAVATGLPDGIELSSFATMADPMGQNGEANGFFEASFTQYLTIGQDPLA